MARKIKSVSGKAVQDESITASLEIHEYIKLFHSTQTIQEIAEMLQVQPYRVSEIAKRLGVTCIKDVDRLKKLILDNADKSANQIAKSCSYTVARIKQVAKELGVVLPEHKRVAHTGKLYNWHKENDPAFKSKYPRVKEAYTQSQSPYGLANELHGIKTK